MTDTLERGALVKKLGRFTKTPTTKVAPPKPAPKAKKAKPAKIVVVDEAKMIEAIVKAKPKAIIKAKKPAMVRATLPETAKKVPTKFKFAVRLRNRYTGITTTLGMRYDTRDAAEKAGATECERCNYIEVVPAMADSYQPVRDQLRRQLRGTI